MRLEEEYKKIDAVYNQLKNLRSEMSKTIKLSDKTFNVKSSSPRQLDRLSANLNYQCMHLEKCRKNFWRTILENKDILDVSLEEREYHLSGFHKYKF